MIMLHRSHLVALARDEAVVARSTGVRDNTREYNDSVYVSRIGILEDTHAQ